MAISLLEPKLAFFKYFNDLIYSWGLNHDLIF